MTDTDLPKALTLPCGCTKGVIKRTAPAINPNGTPKLAEDGSFLMEEIEEIQESYCSEHASALNERQKEVEKALAGGASFEEAMSLLAGVSPFPQLEDGGE